MARTRHEGSNVEANVFSGNRYMAQTSVVTATVTLTRDSPTLQIISSAGGNNVLLPPLATDNDIGMHFVIANGGAGALTIQTSAGGAVGSVATTKTSAFYSGRSNAGVLTWFIHAGA